MIRIDAAIAHAKERGIKVRKKDIAAKLWPDTTEVGQMVNMAGLCTGKRDRIKPEWINIICDMTGCTADFLFGIPEK